MNFGPDTPLKYILGLLGSKGVRKAQPGRRLESAVPPNGVIPNEFDARTYWKKCTIIGAVHDQGNCGCCWVSYAKSGPNKKMKKFDYVLPGAAAKKRPTNRARR